VGRWICACGGGAWDRTLSPVPPLSVVVCTRNRARLLTACLASLEEQSLERDQYEVVVVDNASTDGTSALLRSWQAARAGCVAVREPVIGLSAARNRGLAVADGEIVAFIDDDALAAPMWAAAHLAAYRAPSLVGAGGPILLSFPDGRPPWAVHELEHWWSALDLGDDDMVFPPPHGPYGANMSVRRVAALDVGGFDARLGRRGQSLVSSEEAELWARLWAAGGVLAYCAAGVVIHQVTNERLRRRWVLRRGLAQGRTNALRESPLKGTALLRRLREELSGARETHGPPLRAIVSGPAHRGAVLNDMSRRAGHLAVIAQLAWLRSRTALFRVGG
jgi:glucosyl-dolichyl phosphate glucuronosyltransferase